MEQSDFQLLLTRYVLERLLYRLSVSKYVTASFSKEPCFFLYGPVIVFGLHAILTYSGTAKIALKYSPTSFAQYALNR
jgi:hypothetical protein